MIDQEVEMVLREIRDRVTSQPLPAQSTPALGNGGGNSQAVVSNSANVQSTEALARLNAHLTTTARAWDRLPPLISNRSGVSARIELWIKARLKTFSRWFTWEQVNYNAAVHHALGEALQILSNQEAGITALRAQMESENEANRAEIDALRAQLQSETAARRIDLQNQQKALRAEIQGEVEALRIRAEDQGNRFEIATATRLSEVVNELRDREDQLENEQRVCFKQLSLETSEAVVSNDRAQRTMKALLDDLNQRIKQLEESKSRP